MWICIHYLKCMKLKIYLFDAEVLHWLVASSGVSSILTSMFTCTQHGKGQRVKKKERNNFNISTFFLTAIIVITSSINWGEAPLVRDSRKFVCLSVYVGLTIIKVNKLLTLIAGFAPSMFYILLVTSTVTSNNQIFHSHMWRASFKLFCHLLTRKVYELGVVENPPF